MVERNLIFPKFTFKSFISKWIDGWCKQRKIKYPSPYSEARGSGERCLEAVGESATMYDAAKLMTTNGVHRAWILGVGGIPVGCVSATDVLRCVGSVHRRIDTRPVPIVETPSA